MHKLRLNELSDNDLVIDEEVTVEDSDDCFIVEDLQDMITNKIIRNDQICISADNQNGPKRILSKSQHLRCHKDDNEIYRALSLKNLVKVDLKRNRGLVGMKITQKIQKNTSLNVKIDKTYLVEETYAKQKSVMADEMNSSDAEKILCHIDTQPIPITEGNESNSTCELNINNQEKDLVDKHNLVKPSSFPNVTVHFDITKISEKLMDNLKTKKTNEPPSQAKLASKPPNKSILNNPENTFNAVNIKELSSKVTITKKCFNSSNTVISHVKDVKKTNKYINDQIKMKNVTSQRSLIGLLIKNKTKEAIKEIKHTEQKIRRNDTQNKATKVDRKSCKKIAKPKHEPNSPILHCSTVSKKPKQHEILPKCNKTDTNFILSKEPGELKQIAGKVTNLNSCNLMQDSNRLKHAIPKTAPVITEPLEVYDRKTLQKESFMIEDKKVSKVKKNDAKSFNLVEKSLKNGNPVSKVDCKCNNFRDPHIMSSSQNKILNEQNVIHESRQYKVNEDTLNATVSVTSTTAKAPIKSNKPIVSNSNVSTTAVLTPGSGSNSVLSNQYPNFPTSHGSHFPIHNGVPSKMSSSNIFYNHVNGPVRNRYASAIILNSNNQSDFPFQKYREPPPVQTMGFQRPNLVPVPVLGHTQPRFRDPQPPYPIFYPPDSLGRQQNHFQSSAKSIPNRFHPPQSYIGQQPSNPIQDFYRECWLPQNLAPPPPPPPSVPPLNFGPRNSHVLNQSKDCSNLNSTSTSFEPPLQNPQSAFHQSSTNTQHTQNSSIIGMNNAGLVKKINIVAMPLSNVGTIKVEQINTPQTINPAKHSEVVETNVVETKTEMLKELDNISFIDENTNEFTVSDSTSVINEKKKDNTLEVAIMSQKPETLKIPMNQKSDHVETKPAQGYSPPILPIPTYQSVLDRVTLSLHTKNAKQQFAHHPVDSISNLKKACKPMRKRDFVKCSKRKLNNACNNDEDRRKEDVKKISLEEYKKRILKTDEKFEHYKKTCKVTYDNSGKRPNMEYKYRKNVDYSTETDLGYDSDSTVIL